MSNNNFLGDSFMNSNLLNLPNQQTQPSQTPQPNQQPQLIPSANLHSVSQQQKRQNSLSNYMSNNNSNKRLSNPLQNPLHLNSNTPDYSFLSSINTSNPPTNPSTANANAANAYQSIQQPVINSQRSLNNNRNNFRRSVFQQNLTKTPTPSSYDVPSSPNVNPSISAQNISDLPDSNPAIDQNVQAQTQAQGQTRYMPSSQSVPQLQSHMRDSSLNPLSTVQSILDQETATETPNRSASQDSKSYQQSTTREMTEEEQQLATKLKETYKNIVNYEEIVQKGCLEVSVKITQLSNSSGNLSYNPPMMGLSSSGNNINTNNTNNNNTNNNNVKSSELLNELWTIYHHNISLLDNYTDFLVTALKPSSNQNKDHFKTGKNIVDLYKIPRRMWVYGVVAFLEVLKNIINIFQEHESCPCFIGHCFTIISNLTDPALDMEGWWSEKLGDLSRMAIALYSSRFIDWKLSAEYWYSISMRTLYGHGKIYYHMCTVQQDNLDALVNIGKSVTCRDPFVPTHQYLRLVVENICTQRNILSLLELPIIDFIKIHKVLLSIHTNQISSSNPNNPGSIDNIYDTQLQYGIDLVSRYGITFGSDSNGYNFFTRQLYTPNGITGSTEARPYYMHQLQQLLILLLSPQLQSQPQLSSTGSIGAGASSVSGTGSIEKLNFWLNKGPLFAIANINHIIGLGDSKNPFSKIFLLPEALKERKDKKERKRKSKTSLNEDFAALTSSNNVNNQPLLALEISELNWYYSLKDINKSVLELSIRILKHYLVGPVEASYGHVTIWLYFIISIGEAIDKNPNSKPMFSWLLKYLFPWDLLINYLNTVLVMVKSNRDLFKKCKEYLVNYPNYIQHFNENERLPEVWKCWGTLWFDFISMKTDYSDFETAGIVNYNVFDLPVSGVSANIKASNNFDLMKTKEALFDDSNERVVRIVLLSRFIADNYDFGLIRSHDGFKFYPDIIPVNYSIIPQNINLLMREFLYGDNRFISHNFFDKFSEENNYPYTDRIDPGVLDDEWFEINRSGSSPSNPHQRDEDEEFLEYNDEEAMRDYGESEIEEERRNQELEDQVDKLYNQQHQVLQSHLNFNSYDNPSHPQINNHPGFMINPENLSMISEDTNMGGVSVGGGVSSSGEAEIIEGDLGDRMDTKLTYITLDTNIWLKHCGRVFKCVRSSIFKILIPLIVFQELRSLRKSTEATIADAATRSVIIIRELYSTKEILPLRFNGTVASDINETTEFENNSNWRAGVDETILNAVYEQNEIGKNIMRGLNTAINNNKRILDPKASKNFRYCILITDDRNIRLRAKTLGVTSFQSKWLFNQLETNFYSNCID